MSFKTIGVAIDPWKEGKFKKKIEEEEFEILKIFSVSKHVRVIQVKCPNERLWYLEKIIKELQLACKHSN